MIQDDYDNNDSDGNDDENDKSKKVWLATTKPSSLSSSSFVFLSPFFETVSNFIKVKILLHSEGMEQVGCRVGYVRVCGGRRG